MHSIMRNLQNPTARSPRRCTERKAGRKDSIETQATLEMWLVQTVKSERSNLIVLQLSLTRPEGQKESSISFTVTVTD